MSKGLMGRVSRIRKTLQARAEKPVSHCEMEAIGHQETELVIGVEGNLWARVLVDTYGPELIPSTL